MQLYWLFVSSYMYWYICIIYFTIVYHMLCLYAGHMLTWSV